MDYVTAEEVKIDLVDSGIRDTDEYNAVLRVYITAASRLIDHEVGGWDNYFYPTTDDETRHFDGSGELIQNIDPCISLTSVEVSESGGREASDYTTWTEDTDFYISPYNYAEVGIPIRSLIVDNDAGSKGYFMRVRKGVKVKGIFGYSSTPPDIIMLACKIQVMRWFMRAKQSWQDAGVNSAIGEMLYIQDLDPAVKRLLAPYRRANIV